jgi:hypothetical protein
MALKWRYYVGFAFGLLMPIYSVTDLYRHGME